MHGGIDHQGVAVLGREAGGVGVAGGLLVGLVHVEHRAVELAVVGGELGGVVGHAVGVGVEDPLGVAPVGPRRGPSAGRCRS